MSGPKKQERWRWMDLSLSRTKLAHEGEIWTSGSDGPREKFSQRSTTPKTFLAATAQLRVCVPLPRWLYERRGEQKGCRDVRVTLAAAVTFRTVRWLFSRLGSSFVALPECPPRLCSQGPNLDDLIGVSRGRDRRNTERFPLSEMIPSAHASVQFGKIKFPSDTNDIPV